MIHRILRVFLFVVTGLAIGGFALVGATREHLADPMEDVIAARSARMLQKQPGGVYVEPEPGPAQGVMPGFPLVLAAVSHGFGSEPSTPHVLSVVIAFLIAAMVLLIVRFETASWTTAISGAGFALMGIGLLGGPPGSCDPELPMMLLVLMGCFGLRHVKGPWGAVIAAVLMPLAFFADQQATWFLVAIGVALAIEAYNAAADRKTWADRERFAVYVIIGGFVLGLVYVELSQHLGPWFNFEAWDVPLLGLQASAARPLHFVGDHLLGRLGVPTLATVLTFAMPIQPWRGRSGIWTWIGIGGLAAGLFATQSTAFGPHTLIPSAIVLALLGPISIQRVTGHLSAWPGSTRLGGQSVVLAALTLQSIVFLSCLTHAGWLTGDAPTPQISPPPVHARPRVAPQMAPQMAPAAVPVVKPPATQAVVAAAALDSTSVAR